MGRKPAGERALINAEKQWFYLQGLFATKRNSLNRKIRKDISCSLSITEVL